MGRNTARNDRMFAQGLYDPTRTYATLGPSEEDVYFFLKKRAGIPLTQMEKSGLIDTSQSEIRARLIRDHLHKFATDAEYQAA